jgi:RNA polymerase sigma-70 factor, ECF subfamily
MNEPALDAEKLRALDESTLSKVFEYLLPRIRRLAIHRGATESDADEVVSEVLLYLVRDPDRLAELASAGHLMPYCFTIARNFLVHQAWRTRKHTLSTVGLEELQIDQIAINDRSALQEKDLLLEEALSALDEDSRKLIAMRYFEGRTTQEIAETLGLSATLVKVRLHRIVQRLRKTLEPTSRSEGHYGCRVFLARP